MEFSPLAIELNDVLQRDCPIAFNSLSARGRLMYFPYKGILGQTAEAEGSQLNATIGIALDEDGSPLRLPSVANQFEHDPASVFPYASSFGKKELSERWNELIYLKNPSLESTISLPVTTCGLTHGLDVAGALFVNPGDQIILTDKYWGNYSLTFYERYGADLRFFNTFQGGGFDTGAFGEALVEAIGHKKIVLLNFPNNPSGYTPTEYEAEEIVSILLRRAEAGDRLCVLIDDAYFGLVYEEGIIKESLFARLADLHKNILAVKIDGASKEEYAWGLRVGFITFASKGITEAACGALEYKSAGAVRASVSNVSHLSQTSVLKNLNSETHSKEKSDKYELLKKRYEEVKNVLSDGKYSEYFNPLPFNSGYFMCVELREGLNAEDVRKVLLKEHDCGVIATGNLLRIAYSSLPIAHIVPLFERLYNTCKKIVTEKSTSAVAQ